jgi:hypothetical protein
MRLAWLGVRHDWAQQHLFHYVEGDLSWLARRRMEFHVEGCPSCSRGVRAVRSLLRLMQARATGPSETAPSGLFDRVWLEATRGARGSGAPADG